MGETVCVAVDATGRALVTIVAGRKGSKRSTALNLGLITSARAHPVCRAQRAKYRAVIGRCTVVPYARDTLLRCTKESPEPSPAAANPLRPQTPRVSRGLRCRACLLNRFGRDKDGRP
jgi:hypothetical protein